MKYRVAVRGTAPGERMFLVHLFRVPVAFIPYALTCSAVLTAEFSFNNFNVNIFKVTH